MNTDEHKCQSGFDLCLSVFVVPIQFLGVPLI